MISSALFQVSVFSFLDPVISEFNGLTQGSILSCTTHVPLTSQGTNSAKNSPGSGRKAREEQEAQDVFTEEKELKGI